MYIFEFKDTKDGVVFNRTLEKDLSLVEIYKKYEEIPSFILSKENAGELLNTIKNFVKKYFIHQLHHQDTQFLNFKMEELLDVALSVYGAKNYFICLN